jgi:hypothetical protein
LKIQFFYNKNGAREKIERERDEKGTTVFVVENFNFQIEFSQSKKA